MKKILIMVDVQNDFITGSLANPDAYLKVPAILDFYKSNDWEKTVVTMDRHEEDYLKTLEGKKLPVSHCISNTEGIELDPRLKEVVWGKSIICEKITFGSINLPDIISEIDEKTVIYMCGFCTDICVVSNALLLRAYFPNNKIVVKKDLCSGTSKEAHEAALKVMQSCQIDIE